MKAIVRTSYGPPEVLRCEDVVKPVPGDREVLVEVRACSVNPVDWHLMRGSPYFLRMIAGVRRPKEPGLGVDLAGRVEAVGAGVTSFRPGDEVFGSGRASFAEYACASEAELAQKPGNVTFEQAACAPVAALTALQGLRKGRVQPGRKVLVNGAAGGVGTFAVQIARSLGADVTGVCSTRNVELVRSIGADRVIDYTREDFTRGTQRYDAILDCIGNHSFSSLRRVLAADGACVMVGGPVGGTGIGALADLARVLILSRFVSQDFVGILAKSNREDLTTVGDLMSAGKVTPVVDRRYPLSEVADAIRYLEAGHARGKVVITIES